MSQQDRLGLTHGSIVGDGVHAERQLLAWVLQQLTPLREGLGNHLALLDPLRLIITLPSQPEKTKVGLAGRGGSTCGDTHQRAAVSSEPRSGQL